MLGVEAVQDADAADSSAEGAVASLAHPAAAVAAAGAAAGAEADMAEDAARGLGGAADALEALVSGGARADAAAAAVCEAAWQLSFHSLGSRAVQIALERAGPAHVERALAGLRGSIATAVRSPHASVVVEKAIHVSGRAAAESVATELSGHGHAAAFSSGGSCVVRTLLEHAAGQPWVVSLTDEILAEDLATLCCHKAGHRVAEAVLSNGLARQRAAVVAALRGDLMRFAKHRFGAAVLQQALLQGAPRECQSLAQAVMAPAGAVAALGCHCFGVHVVRALLQVPGASEIALGHVRKYQHKLRRDRFGAELLRELGLAGPSDPKAGGDAQQGQSRAQAHVAQPGWQGFAAIVPRFSDPTALGAMVQCPACLPGPATKLIDQRCSHDCPPFPLGAAGGA